MLEKEFWLKKKLSQMSSEEWEALCDGCGKCCVNILENDESGELFQTNVACFMLDHHSCQCKDYPNRKKHVPQCVKLTPENVVTFDWLPDSCAYRRVSEGKNLLKWHHLRSGDREFVHKTGHSIRNKVISELEVENLEDHIIAWFK